MLETHRQRQRQADRGPHREATADGVGKGKDIVFRDAELRCCRKITRGGDEVSAYRAGVAQGGEQPVAGAAGVA